MLRTKADWDYRNQCTASTTLSLTKKAADTLDRRQDNPTDHTRSQVNNIVFFFVVQYQFICIHDVHLGHSSPGGDLSDEELCSGIANIAGGTATPLGSGYGPNEFEPLCLSSGSGIVEFAQPQQSATQQYTRPRSGSCASRRSQFR